jgi:hypothetical protein
MKITFSKGKLWNDDKLFFIETKGEEPFTLYRLLLLVNQLSLNEYGRYKEKGFGERGLPFFFEESLLSVIDLGKRGTDLIEDKNNDISEELCKRYGLNFNKWKQTKLQDFFKENGTP